MKFNITPLFLLISILTFFGCSTKNGATTHNTKENAPAWVRHPETLPPYMAVGIAMPNFQGIYIQHQSALNSAKNELSHTIKTTLTSEYTREIQLNNSHVTSSVHSRIQDISNALVKNSHQVDAYFNDMSILYVLVESKELAKLTAYKSITIMPLSTRINSNEKLLESRCYPKEQLNLLKNDTALFQNKPEWFFRQNIGNVYGSVGISEKSASQTYELQYKRALLLAKSSYSQSKQVKVESKYDILNMIKHDTSGHIFETSSVLKSTNKLNNLKVKASWLDPKSCELYIWIMPKP